MAGTRDIGSYRQTNYVANRGPAQTGSAYPNQIDDNFAVAQRFVDCFAPRFFPGEASMAVFIDPGFIYLGGSAITELGGYITGDTTLGSKIISNVTADDFEGIANGQAIISTSFPDGTLIASFNATAGTITTDTNATVSDVDVATICGDRVAIPAPVTHPRRDLIVYDALTGAKSRIAGTEAVSPVAPSIPAGKMPICWVTVQTTSIFIGGSMIEDKRLFGGGGSAGGFGTCTDIAPSTGTVDLGTLSSHYGRLTGSGANITSFGSTASLAAPVYRLRASATNTIKYDPTAMQTPGQIDIALAADDEIVAAYLGTGNWKVIGVSLASGKALVTPASGITGAVKNLQITGTNFGGAAAASVSYDELFLTDSSGNEIKDTAAAVSPSGFKLSTAGANGLDTGVPAVSKVYHIWRIAKADGTKAWLYSLSATAPAMPSGYIYSARLGAVVTGSGSSTTFLTSSQVGREFQFNLPLLVDSGNKGNYSTGAITWTTVAAAAFMPTTAVTGKWTVTSKYNGGAASNVAIAPNTNYGGYQSLVPAPLVLETNCSASIEMPGGGVQWATNAAGAGLLLRGWTDGI